MVEKKYLVNLNNIDKVKKFNAVVSQNGNAFDLVSGRYVIDAKSIMGIFSLDLSKDIELVAHFEDGADVKEFEASIAEFLAV